MREYKFCGKRRDEKWVHGSLVIGTNNESTYIFTNIGEQWSVVPKTVCQFTGLRDDKRTEQYPEGQEIYEKDIILCTCGNISVKNIVVFNQKVAGFQFQEENGVLCPISNYKRSYTMHKIGNIYDNPELLEENLIYGQ